MLQTGRRQHSWGDRGRRGAWERTYDGDVPSRITTPQRKKYIRLREAGWTQAEAADKAEISRSSAYRIDQGLAEGVDSVPEGVEREEKFPDPKSYEELSADGKRAVDEFVFFATEFLDLSAPGYWGFVATEVDRIAKLGVLTEEFNRILMTFHPGAGKTTLGQAYLFWRIIRARAMGDYRFSTIFGSITEKLAKRIIRMITWHADNNRKLISTFGRIRPISDDGETTWTKDEIMFAGMGGGSKEATLKVFGAGQSIVGVRPNLAIWDDLVERMNSSPRHTAEMREWWDGEPDTRMEPGGVILVTGHFFTPNDFYHSLKDMTFVEDDGTELKVWKHFRFKAHDESLCPVALGTGTEHTEFRLRDDGQVEGCLLWPKRFTYRQIMYHRQKNTSLFELQYQSEDGVSGEVLAPKIWIEGGIEGDGSQYPGCLDRSRRLDQFPPRFDFVLATLDPSPTKFAAAGAWAFDGKGHAHHLVKFERRRMTTEEYPRLIRAWTEEIRKSWPAFNTWVVEKTGADYLHGAESMQSLPQELGIQIIAHDTKTNKNHQEYGIWAYRDEWRYGRMQIPYADARTQETVRQILEEHWLYPYDETDDTVLMTWFYHLHRATVEAQTQRRIDGYLKRKAPGFVRRLAEGQPRRTVSLPEIRVA